MDKFKIGYYAIFDYSNPDEIEYGVEISFKDIENLATCARNREEGIKFAKEVLSLYFHRDIESPGFEFPKASVESDFELSEDEELIFIEIYYPDDFEDIESFNLE